MATRSTGNHKRTRRETPLVTFDLKSHATVPRDDVTAPDTKFARARIVGRGEDKQGLPIYRFRW